MFSYIKGPLAEVSEDVIVVEAGNIGWNIHVPLSVLERLPHIGEEVQIYTSFQVREDAMALYGFLSRQDLQMFRMLLGVNGIGPKAALGILSTMRPEDLRMAVISEDAKSIARAPGIGAKTAKRIILDLKDRMKTEDILPGGFSGEETASGRMPAVQLPGNGAAKEAVEALVALGYSLSEASKAVRQVPMDGEMTAEAVLKASLKYLVF
ncbi:MAG: Holliday junction branch migration protein RuvA [Lachnospiraceae bacterium]|nr:Holliday junction branch migration protein RuvA [Lachnospiraceae bacterium]